MDTENLVKAIDVMNLPASYPRDQVQQAQDFLNLFKSQNAHQLDQFFVIYFNMEEVK